MTTKRPLFAFGKIARSLRRACEAGISLVLLGLLLNLAFVSGGKMAFAISSTSFPNGGDIPKKFTCDGADVSPELAWTDPPPGTKSFALIADDPDAPSGTWTHWLLFNVPPIVGSLPEGVSKIDELPGGERQGRNDFHKIGYNGPCPPPGKPHRYFFKLYALDGTLDLKPGASKQEVEQAMQSRILNQAEWIGKYRR
jgi:Raf kinase inhibitor-like YbhB/YbcL family protein